MENLYTIALISRSMEGGECECPIMHRRCYFDRHSLLPPLFLIDARGRLLLVVTREVPRFAFLQGNPLRLNLPGW